MLIGLQPNTIASEEIYSDPSRRGIFPRFRNQDWLALFATTSMAIFVAAVPSGVNVISNSCNTGSIQCCMSFLFLHCKEFKIPDLLILKVTKFSSLPHLYPNFSMVCSTPLEALLDHRLVKLVPPALPPPAGKYLRSLTI